MFFVINKSKILSYLLAICTVVILFMLASGSEDVNNTISTSANILNENIINQNSISDNNTIDNMENNVLSNDINNIIDNSISDNQ